MFTSSMSSSGTAAGMGRHQNAEGGAARLRLAFDDAAMVADDLGDQRQAEAGAVGLGGDERIEEVGQHVLRHARPVVDAPRTPAAGSPGCGCRASRGGCPADRRCGRRSPASLRAAERFGGVLHQVEEDLDQLVAVGVDRRKRRIVFLHDADVPREPVAGDHLYPLQDGVDVDRLRARSAARRRRSPCGRPGRRCGRPRRR